MDDWKLKHYKQRLQEATDNEQIDIIAEMLDEEEVITEGMMDTLIDLGLAGRKFFKALGKRPNKLVQAISNDTGIPAKQIMQMSQAERVDLKHKWMLGLQDGVNDAFNEAFRSMRDS